MSRDYSGILSKVATVWAVVGGLYHILYVSRALEYLDIYISGAAHNGFHVAFVLALVYLLFPAKKGRAVRSKLAILLPSR